MKKDLIFRAFEDETMPIQKELARLKEINQELIDITETYERNVLDRFDEIEQYGYICGTNAKKYNLQIIKVLDLMIPPTELRQAIDKLERNLIDKHAERDKKIKNLKSKSKNKKKAPKPKPKIMPKPFEERVQLFTKTEKMLFL